MGLPVVSVTEASVPGSPVVTVPIVIVSALPAGPCGPAGHIGPNFSLKITLSPHGGYRGQQQLLKPSLYFICAPYRSLEVSIAYYVKTNYFVNIKRQAGISL